MPIRLDGSTGITVGTAVTVGTSDIKVGNVVNLNQTSLSGITTAGITTAYIGSINDGPISGFRNLVINGGFDVWQRGTSFTDNTVYTSDRWWFVNDAVGTATVTRQDISSQGLGSQYCLRAERSSGTNRWVVGTNLETNVVKSILGKQITVSFYVRKGSAFTSDISVTFGTSNTEAKFGSLIDFNNFTISNSSLNTSTFTKFSGTVNVGSASTALGLKLELSASQAGASNAYFEVAQVQIEEGPIATPFERRSFGQELALCQRYYEKSFNLSTAPAQAVGTGAGCFQAVQVVGQAAAQYCGSVSFKVTKRTAPSLVTLYNPISANAQFYNANTGGSTSSTASSDASEAGFHLNTVTQSGSGSAGNGLFIHWTATAEL
jgi:hypothetical protein